MKARRLVLTQLASALIAWGAMAQDPAMEILAMLSGHEDSPLDFIASSVQVESGREQGVLDFISSTVAGSSCPGDMAASAEAFPFSGRKITSLFGYRPKFGRMHKGIDVAMAIGDTVRVPIPGTVREIGYEAKGYGHYVTVEHDDGMETRYAHLSRTLVAPGDYIAANQPIALSGNSGNSTGPHLHFETLILGKAVNPTEVFSFTAGHALPE